ncbi:MAG TPA: hypothetical protein VFI43_02920 [Nitrosospira sp.]|nr:hypothetical protein [Nitrosospira sp.]
MLAGLALLGWTVRRKNSLREG